MNRSFLRFPVRIGYRQPIAEYALRILCTFCDELGHLGALELGQSIRDDHAVRGLISSTFRSGGNQIRGIGLDKHMIDRYSGEHGPELSRCSACYQAADSKVVATVKSELGKTQTRFAGAHLRESMRSASAARWWITTGIARSDAISNCRSNTLRCNS